MNSPASQNSRQTQGQTGLLYFHQDNLRVVFRRQCKLARSRGVCAGEGMLLAAQGCGFPQETHQASSACCSIMWPKCRAHLERQGLGTAGSFPPPASAAAPVAHTLRLSVQTSPKAAGQQMNTLLAPLLPHGHKQLRRCEDLCTCTNQG